MVPQNSNKRNSRFRSEIRNYIIKTTMSVSLRGLWVFLFLIVTLGSDDPHLFTYASSADDSSSHEKALEAACGSTLYPEFCVSAMKSYKEGPWTTAPKPLDFGKLALGLSIREAKKLSRLISKLGRLAHKEQQRYAVDDCMQLFEITLDELSQCLANVDSNPNLKWKQSQDIKTWLSAALTNQETCRQSLQESKGSTIQYSLGKNLSNVTKTLSNSLAIVNKISKSSRSPSPSKGNRRLLSAVPSWLSESKRRTLLQNNVSQTADVVTVAQDGSGNFTTLTDAINAAPNKSDETHVIYVKAGVYSEYIVVSSHKWNIMLIGDGANSTIITGNRSVGGGWTTFRSATFAAVGNGFMAKDITFENTAGPENHQAVALRVGSDHSAFYRCIFKGYQDTLYAHSLRQFYRECDIYGTVDFIFGNAAAVFQKCNLYARQPLSGQTDIYTAQGRNDPNENTGISIHKCNLTLDPNVNITAKGSFDTYLGRPWRNYSRTVVMDSFIEDVVNPKGWQEWSGDQGLATLYYGEYMNSGPGAGVASRVNWPGYHVMNASDALNFTVSNFIAGDTWIASVPFEVGL